VGIRPFPESSKYTHILAPADYVIKWLEAIPTKSVDRAIVVKMFKDIILPRFGVPRFLITDGGSHFLNVAFRIFLSKYGVTYRFSSLYHLKPVVKLN
jgi:hypothetical protein